MLSRRQILFLLLALFGFVAMAWSANDWYELMRGERMSASFCTLNSYWNCDRASLSWAGSIGPVPIGLFGAAWFWIVPLLVFGAPRLRWLAKLLLDGGLIVAVCLGYFLSVKLHTGCLVCYFSYACIFGMWVLARHTDPAHFPALMKKKLTNGLVLGGLAALTIFAISNSYRMEKIVSEEEFQKWFQSMQPQTLPANSIFSKGNPNGKIVVAEFSDFGCPVCERAANVLLPFFTSQEDVKVLFYPFPLDAECNPNVPRSVHPHACDWVRVGICAEEQGKFWPFHDKVFKLASDEGRLPSVDSAIASFDLDQEKLKACLAKAETSSTLKQLVDVGIVMDIRNTPTFFIAGRKIEGFIPIPYFKRLLLEIRRL